MRAHKAILFAILVFGAVSQSRVLHYFVPVFALSVMTKLKHRNNYTLRGRINQTPNLPVLLSFSDESLQWDEFPAQQRIR